MDLTVRVHKLTSNEDNFHHFMISFDCAIGIVECFRNILVECDFIVT